MADINDDLDLLENMTADDQSVAHPEQDNPLQHVPEDALRNLDSLVVDFAEVQDQADTALRVAVEAEQINACGRIDKLRVEEIAKDVPAVMGSADAPISYTTVPTAIGVTKAVELMHESSSNTRDAAVTKARELIDRSIVAATNELSSNETEWVSVLSSYSMAQTEAVEKLGALPEDSYDVYIGNEPAPEVLARPIVPGTEETGLPVVDSFRTALSSVINRSVGSPEITFFMAEPVVVVGEIAFSVAGLIAANAEPLTPTRPGYASMTRWLGWPAAKLPSVVTELRSASISVIEMLRGISVSFAEDPEMSALNVTKQIQRVVLYVSLLASINRALKGAVVVTQAATDFYKSMAVGTNAATVDMSSIAREGYRRNISRLFR